MLDLDSLKKKLSSFSDIESEDFINWPESLDQSAQFFGEALELYVKEIIPNSTTKSAAKESFISIFKTMSDASYNGPIIIVNALNSFMAILGSGMIGQMSIVSVIPPVFTVADFSSIWASGFAGSKTSEIITQFSAIIDVKTRIGQGITAIGNPIMWI